MNKSIPSSPQQYIDIDLAKILEYSAIPIISIIIIGSILGGIIPKLNPIPSPIPPGPPGPPGPNGEPSVDKTDYAWFTGPALLVLLIIIYYILVLLMKKKILFSLINTYPFLFILYKKLPSIILFFSLGFLAIVSIYFIIKNINSIKIDDSTKYEGFDNKSITTEMIKQKTNDLQKALDSIEVMDEETCNILNNIESKFMDNATVPQSDESNLSETTKQSMKNRRIEKAKTDWKMKKQDYEGKTKQYGSAKIMECFENNITSDEFNEAVNELYDLLNSPSVSNIDLKLNRMNITNDFSLMYANKFATEASDVLAKKEGFETSLENKIEKNPIELMKQANNIIQKIEQTKTILEKAQRSSNAINNMTSNPNTISNIVSN